jgi:hypothetical protein
MRWLGLWLSIMLLSQRAVAQVVLADEPHLKRNITLWLKMEPLRDVLRTVSRQTGVSLRCQDAIQYEKVSIFVENRPAYEILTQLASLFRYAWRKDKDAYVLYVPNETRQQEESVIRAAREARRRALQDVIRFAREALQNPPDEADIQRRKPNEGAPAEEWNRWLVYWYRPWNALQKHAQQQADADDSLDWLYNDSVLLALLAQMPLQAEHALLNGRLIGFSTRPAPGIYQIPEEVRAPSYLWGHEIYEEPTDTGTVFRSRPARNHPEFWGVWIRFAERGNFVEYEFVVFRRDTFTVGYEDRPPPEPRLHRVSHRFMFHITPYVDNHPWVVQWRMWATPPKERESRVPENALTQRDDRPKPSLEREAISEYPSHIVNSSDLLEWFAWSTRMPVIAESFRTDNLYASEINLNAPRSILGALSRQAWIRIDELGYVLYRVQWYWGRRLVELPEDWLRPLERRFAQQRWLDLEDYIALAGRMNNLQASYYEQLHGLDVAVRFPFATLAQNLRGLRFLASLSALQRRQLLSGEWMLANMLTMPQRQRFHEALEERFPPPERLLVIDFPYQFSDWRRMDALGSAPVISTANLQPVDAPAFRLQFSPEKPLRYEVRRASGVSAYFPLESVIAEVSGFEHIEDTLPGFRARFQSQLQQSLVQQILQWLNEEPGLNIYLVHAQGYALELQAPPAQRKTYYIFQRRPTPVDPHTLEAKLKSEGKPSEDAQTKRP